MNKKIYNIKEIEKFWINKWNSEKDYFSIKFNNNNLCFKNNNFSVLMPPPNITGILHNGHALFITLQDILIRFNKMIGKNVYWISGADHAGIATQVVIEKYLFYYNKIAKADITAEGFLFFFNDWKKEKILNITNQIKGLAAFIDWNFFRFTMDKNYIESVYKCFSILWANNLIYRGERLVNWDYSLKTAISDEEVEYIESDNLLWNISYKILDSNDIIIVSTTRPETVLADVALAVNPEDIRYKKYLGKFAVHPLLKKNILIISDNKVDMKYGTGVLKITPGHDFNDFDIASRHNLNKFSIYDYDGFLNENAFHYQGLTIKESRDVILRDLKKNNSLLSNRKIKSNIAVSQRTNSIIEPLLSKQYFLDMKKISVKTINYLNTFHIYLFPDYNIKNLILSLKNIKDWCISRQIFCGHEIPIYYNLNLLKNIILEENKNLTLLYKMIIDLKNTDIKKLKKEIDKLSDDMIKKISFLSFSELNFFDGFLKETDVLDTWFSSSLFSFVSLDWKNKDKKYGLFYPNTVLETGYDILFFWVTRMILMGLYFTGRFPFKYIYLHGILRDNKGKKISKSSGNSIDPLDLVKGISLDNLISKITFYLTKEEIRKNVIVNLKKDFPAGIPEFGVDSLRISLSFFSNSNINIKLDTNIILSFKFFLNKIWNMSNFLELNSIYYCSENLNFFNSFFFIEDKWILSLFHKMIFLFKLNLKNFNFSKTIDLLFFFFKSNFCDWYIEICKFYFKSVKNFNILNNKKSIIFYIFSNFILLLHPFCPFISEEIWSKFKIGKEYCLLNSTPIFYQNFLDKKSELSIDFLKNVIILIRRIKKEFNIKIDFILKFFISIKTNDFYIFINNYFYIINYFEKIHSLLIDKKINIFKGYLNLEKNSLYNFYIIVDKTYLNLLENFFSKKMFYICNLKNIYFLNILRKTDLEKLKYYFFLKNRIFFINNIIYYIKNGT